MFATTCTSLLLQLFIHVYLMCETAKGDVTKGLTGFVSLFVSRKLTLCQALTFVLLLVLPVSLSSPQSVSPTHPHQHKLVSQGSFLNDVTLWKLPKLY